MTQKEKLYRNMQILLFFMKIGFFTFGGGWSILSQIQKEFVEKKKWISDEELLDMTSVGRSVPGIMITNISAIFGYHIGGIPCAMAALIGITLPSLIVLSVVTIFYEEFRNNLYVSRVLVGIRASVVPIIASAALKLRKSALKDSIGYMIAFVAFFLSFFTDLNNIFIVIIGAVGGLLIMEVKNGTR